MTTISPASLIKKAFNTIGFTVTRNIKPPKVIPNFFNTDYKKYALLSYIKNVFNKEYVFDERHTNKYTTYIIAETLSQLGYNVDIIDHTEVIAEDFTKYDLVLGLGKTVDHVLEFRDSSSKTKVIWFGTGCNPFYSSIITIERLGDFYKKHHKLFFSSARFIKEDEPLQHEFADWIILHGRHFAMSTYSNKNISPLYGPVFIKQSVVKTDDEWIAAKPNYIWFGSDGAIHKGLDLLIDAFKEMPDCNLYICGNLEKEKDLLSYYAPVINSHPNIILQGFINVNSGSFEEILRKCAFVIYPSAAEGNSPAVVTLMANGGLIPVVTKQTDVDLNGYGIVIDDLSIEAVTRSVKESQKLSIDELKKQSAIIMNETQRLHSFDYFKVDFKEKLEKAIKAIN